MHPDARTLRLACPSGLLTTFRKAREKALVEFINGKGVKLKRCPAPSAFLFKLVVQRNTIKQR